MSRLLSPADEARFANKTDTVQLLRRTAAKRFHEWPPENFLDMVLQKAMWHRFGHGAFLDEWNPREDLESHGFGCLLHEMAETVLAFEEHANGDASLRIKFTDARRNAGGSHEETMTVVNGVTQLMLLREAIEEHYSAVGNCHWGDQTDVRHLSEVFDIGILVFSDQLQNQGHHCLCSVGSHRTEYPFWIAIWWDQPTHFRLAEAAPCKLETDEPRAFQCYWNAAQLLPSLHGEYQDCNRCAN